MTKCTHYDFIDAVKGILILLVVLGHVIGGQINQIGQGGGRLLQLTVDVIYLFHMPAFFFIAGMVWRDRDEPITSFLAKKFHRLIVPYFFWGFVSLVVYTILEDKF
jgi:fucose 4-O-acetylase-like acetyltransferase